MILEYKAAVIKDEIECVFGRRIISSKDCIDLSIEIYRKTQQQLNPNTLRRFFGLVKAEYPPSQSTLTILSKYCGFRSVDDIFIVKQKNYSKVHIEQESLLHYLLSLFQDTNITDSNDKTFLSLVKHTIQFMNADPILADNFQILIATTKNGQAFYFEQFVNVDKLNVYYSNGLRYYLNEKRTPEADIFVHSVLIFRWWLNGNNEKLLQLADHLSTLNGDGLLTNPYISCRYYSACLFYDNITLKNSEATLIRISKLYSFIISTLPERQLLHFEFVIAEALLLIGDYNEVLHYLSRRQKQNKWEESDLDDFSLDNFKLLEAFALYKIGNNKHAEEVFDEIMPSNFNFLSKQFFGILYIYLSNQLQRKISKYPEILDAAINEIGFMRLKEILK